MHTLIGQKPMYYHSIKHRKSDFYCFFATLPLYHKANEEALTMYYTVIKHDRHLRTRRKCRKHEPQAAYDLEVMWQKNNKTRFSYVLYFYKTRVFDQSERAQGPIYIIIRFMLLCVGACHVV